MGCSPRGHKRVRPDLLNEKTNYRSPEIELLVYVLSKSHPERTEEQPRGAADGEGTEADGRTDGEGHRRGAAT